MNIAKISFLCTVALSLLLGGCGDCVDNANCRGDTDSGEPDASQFVTVWKTDNDGASGSNQIKIDTTGDGYAYTVDWGDDNKSFGVTGDIVHTYDTPGTYTIKISGQFPRLWFEPVVLQETPLGDMEEVFVSDNRKLLSVEQWGSIRWESMESAFRDASNVVINASDRPDLSRVSSLSNMFSGASSFNQSINDWDVSAVTDFSGMFAGAAAFNQPLSGWNLSRATDTSNMFFDATAFNQDIGNWDVSSVTTMSGMFWGARAFNQDISSWDVAAVTDMSRLFAGAEAFDQPIGQWDTANVTSLSGTFASALSFNQALSDWDVSAVTDMSLIFRRAELFNQPLDSWDVRAVTNFSEAFRLAANFNQTLSTWNVSQATNMSRMFEQAQRFAQPLDNWNVRNVEDMTNMLSGSAMTTVQYDATLNSWSRQAVKAGVSLGAGTIQYSSNARVGREILTRNYQWAISDGGEVNQP